MRSLFLKIFLWFGLAMVLVNIASFFTGIVIERRSQTTRTNPMAPMFGVYAQTAVEVLERDGRPALAAYLQRVEAHRIFAAIWTITRMKFQLKLFLPERWKLPDVPPKVRGLFLILLGSNGSR